LSIQLCILQSGEINPAIADDLPSYQDMYTQFLSTNAPSVDITYIQARFGEFPASIDDFDAYLITGSPSGAYDEENWIATLHDFIREIFNAKKPILGICFGHQVIANALGGKAEKSDKGWGVGIRTIPVINSSGLIPEDCREIALLYMHQDQITVLPDGATVLMGDEFCPFAAYHISNQVLCIQGHPEFTREVVGAIIDHRIDQIGEERAAKGHASLIVPDQSRIIGRMFNHFLTNALKK
jgi:GMP synthase-like glutamine amidotransferase